MIIKGKVHCFFEQSGTFKREFEKLGFAAEDYDLQDNYGETNHVIDLFSEIDAAYEGQQSVFDLITQDDLIIAFYPCIFFCATSQMSFSLGCVNYRALNTREAVEKILKRNKDRSEYYERLVKFVCVCVCRERAAANNRGSLE